MDSRSRAMKWVARRAFVRPILWQLCLCNITMLHQLGGFIGESIVVCNGVKRNQLALGSMKYSGTFHIVSLVDATVPAKINFAYRQHHRAQFELMLLCCVLFLSFCSPHLHYLAHFSHQIALRLAECIFGLIANESSGDDDLRRTVSARNEADLFKPKTGPDKFVRKMVESFATRKKK